MPPDESFTESVWLIKVKDSFASAVEMINMSLIIVPGHRYTEGRFMEKVDVLRVSVQTI